MTPSNVGGSSVASNVGGATTAVLPAAQQPMSAAASSKPSLRLSAQRSPSRPRKRASTLAAAAQSSLRRRSRAVAPERDDVIGRVREQLTQAARRHEVNLRFTTERIASSTANSAPIKRYAIKPL